MKIKDPLLYQIIFLLNWHAFENELEFQWHKEAIKDFLLACWEKANPTQPFPEEKVNEFLNKVERYLFPEKGSGAGDSLNIFKDIRVLSTSGKVNEKDIDLEARTFDDTLRIHLIYKISGEESTEIFGRLKDNALKTKELREKEAGKHTYIGEVYYLVAEIIGECNEEKAKELAFEILKPFGEYQKEEFIVLKFDWGYLVIHPEIKEMPVILYYPKNEYLILLAQLVHKILPYLFLNRCKFQYVFWLTNRLRAKIETKEKEINDLCERCLSGITRQSEGGEIRGLRKMEDTVANLSKMEGTFVKQLTDWKGYIREIEVILTSLEELLERKVFNGHQSELKELWTKDVSFGREQLEANLRFYTLTREMADSTLDALYKIAQIRDAQWDRVTNWLIGILAVWAIMDVFESDVPSWFSIPSWIWRIVIMITGGYLFHKFILPRLRYWLKI